jgi:hypothetical protein
MVDKQNAQFFFRTPMCQHFELRNANAGYLVLLQDVTDDLMDWTDGLNWNNATYLAKLGLIVSEVDEIDQAYYEYTQSPGSSALKTHLICECSDLMLRVLNFVELVRREVPTVLLSEVLQADTVIDNRYVSLNKEDADPMPYLYFISTKVGSMCNYFRHSRIDEEDVLDIMSRLNQILYMCFVLQLKLADRDIHDAQHCMDFIVGQLKIRMLRNRNKVTDRLV